MTHDLVIIGGGINGAGIARDAAGRGASVLLIEAGDLGGATSSASSKLIHGGLRYLEQFRFGLVREALAEREVLWRMAPHLIRPLRFVLPLAPGMRPAWMLRAGLFLYDRLALRHLLPDAETLNLRAQREGEDLGASLTTGFAYSDCAVDDSRLVLLNARDAADRGADIRTRAKVVRIARRAGAWRIGYLEDGRMVEVEARALVNAAGAWAGEIASLALGVPQNPLRLVRGSHIAVRRRFSHRSAYVLQNRDGRIVFLLPWEEGLTLIGTTDVDHRGDAAHPAMSPAERDYLLEAANLYLRNPLSADDIVHEFSGVRALYDDGSRSAQAATREYALALDARGAPILSVYGGKITTYRRLAEAAIGRLAPWLPALAGPRWTATAPLPGGDFPIDGRPALLGEFMRRYPFAPPSMLDRLTRAHGTRAARILGGARSMADFGPCFGADLYEAELRYLMDHEWARTAEDVLWRRGKLGLAFDAVAMAALDGHMRAARAQSRFAAE